MARDLSALIDHVNTVISIEPIDDVATDQDGAAAELDTFTGVGICIVAVVGTSVFTPTASNMLELEVEESEDGTNFTDVADANLTRTQLSTVLVAAATNTGTFAVIDATTRDVRVYTTTYLPTSKDITHIRVVANFSGTVTGGIPLAAFITQAHPASAPTAQWEA